MNEPNFSIEMFKESPVLSQSSAESLNQQLLYMNNILTLNSTLNLNQSSVNLSQFTKEQITEYQLAKLRLNSELLQPNTFYNYAYNYAHYSEPPKSTTSVPCYNRIDPNRYRYMHDEPKPQHSYIGLIAMAILSMPDEKMVLSDIYQYILDNYAYFRNRGPGWRNSIRHNLSLNDCFIKSGRSANGKGHYWAIHPANLEDFKKGDFRRRKAQRKVRKHMGLSVPEDDEDDDSPVPSPIPPIDKAALAPTNLFATNPFLQVSNTALLNPANSLLTQQAFNIFNTLRFSLPPTINPNASAQFNETLYRQLIDLNIKQDLHSNNKSNSRTQFSIESLLAHQTKSSESDTESEYENFKRLKTSPHEEETSTSDSSAVFKESDKQGDSNRNVPVNLKIN